MLPQSYWSQLSFSWVAPLLASGTQAPLMPAHLFHLEPDLEPRTCSARLWVCVLPQEVPDGRHTRSPGLIASGASCLFFRHNMPWLSRCELGTAVGVLDARAGATWSGARGGGAVLLGVSLALLWRPLCHAGRCQVGALTTAAATSRMHALRDSC